mgnify:CR=1 FL=1
MKKKYKIIIAIFCISSVIGWIFFESMAHTKAHYPIRQVIIEGEYWQVPQVDLEKIIAPYTERGYFFANLFSLQRQLKDDEPWIQSSAVSRHWPDTIVVVLKQKMAVATLNHNSLVTQDGHVFSPPVDSFPPDLPVLIGPKEKAAELLKTYHLFTFAADSVNLTVNQLELSSEGNWSVTLSNKIVVMLGEDDILARFKRFTKVYEQVFVPQHREPSSVDMRYSHGMAVNWKS